MRGREDYGLTPQVDACVLGGRMYPGYEQYWTAIQDAPDAPNPMGAGVPTPAEVEWGRFAAATPHYVVSRTLNSAKWPLTSFLRGLDEVAALKQQPGQDIYLMGGAEIMRACLKAGLVDEVRFIVYPLIAGAGPSGSPGRTLPAQAARRRGAVRRPGAARLRHRVTHAYGQPRAAEFNAGIVAEFRARGGHASGPSPGTPLMLVHHTGARSGIERVVPLAYLPQPGGRFVIIASDGGSPRHPAWYYNLKANPKVRVEVGTQAFLVVAEELDTAARSAPWPAIVDQVPAAGKFQEMTTRTIPVLILTREG